MYAIEFINTTQANVNYSVEAEAAYNAGNDNVINEYTLRFEQDCAEVLRGCDSDDIGGLIVYTNAGDVRAVYDYENFCGWTVA